MTTDAPAGGIFHDLTVLIISNESTTEVRVDIRDATAGSVVLPIDLAADGGGAVLNFSPPFIQTTGANNWTAQLSSNATSVYVTAQTCTNN